MVLRLASFVLPCALLLACSDVGPSDPGGGADDPPAEELVSGRFELTSHFDLRDADGSNAQIDGALGALTGLSESPGATVLALLAAADLPVLDDLFDALPAVVEAQLAGMIDDYLATHLYQGVPAAEQIAGLVDDLATILTNFEVVTTFELGIDASGVAAANHALAAVAFELDGSRQVIDTPSALDLLSTASDVSCELVGGDPPSELAIGDHAFHLPLGDFAVVAVNQLIAARLGVPDLAAALGLWVDCAALASQIAGQCLGPICVGHQAELAAACVAGLDQVAGAIEARIAGIEYAELALAGGHGVLIDGKADEAVDGRIDHIEQGAWQAVFDLDGTTLPVAATFVGQRVE